VTLAHAMVKLLYDGSRLAHRTSKGKSVGMGGPINSLLQASCSTRPVRLHEKVAFQGRLWLQKLSTAGGRGRAAPRRSPVREDPRLRSARAAGDAGFRKALAAAKRTDDRIFLVVSNLVNRIFQRYVDRIAAAKLARHRARRQGGRRAGLRTCSSRCPTCCRTCTRARTA
jgi:hypothetical protein